MAPNNPFDCMMDADDYANMDQVHQTTQFLFKKKKAHIVRTGYQYESRNRM